MEIITRLWDKLKFNLGILHAQANIERSKKTNKILANKFTISYLFLSTIFTLIKLLQFLLKIRAFLTDIIEHKYANLSLFPQKFPIYMVWIVHVNYKRLRSELRCSVEPAKNIFSVKQLY